jgi:hypothetical protein
MLIGDFVFRTRFASIDDTVIQESILYIETTWAGVPDMWSTLPKLAKDNKVKLCFSYLVAWYLADMYPTSAGAIYTTGGAPLRSKDIGGTMLSYNARKVQAELEPLTSNMYGIKALDMITTCPDRFLLR